jgi:hypothetical protein
MLLLKSKFKNTPKSTSWAYAIQTFLLTYCTSETLLSRPKFNYRTGSKGSQSRSVISVLGPGAHTLVESALCLCERVQLLRNGAVTHLAIQCCWGEPASVACQFSAGRAVSLQPAPICCTFLGTVVSSFALSVERQVSRILLALSFRPRGHTTSVLGKRCLRAWASDFHYDKLSYLYLNSLLWKNDIGMQLQTQSYGTNYFNILVIYFVFQIDWIFVA